VPLSRVRSNAIRRSLKSGLPAPVFRLVRAAWRALGQNSMVTRQPRPVRWFRRTVLRRPPVLQHFEIHLTDHCNLNCKGCSHFSNLASPWFAEETAFAADMRTMAALFPVVRHVYLLGGEPLLHPRVERFVYLTREIFPTTEIHLLTNGTLVTQMAEEVWRALAETGVVLTCDQYPVDLPKPEIDALAATHKVQIEWTEPRDTFYKIPLDPSGARDAVRSFAECGGYNNCPIVRDGRLYPCSYTAYVDIFQQRFGLPELSPSPADSLDLRSVTDAEEAMRFLTRPVPWCAHCDTPGREFFEWGPSSRDASEWLEGASG